MGDVGLAIQRAEDKTAQMQARAGAIDELLASGALEDFSGPKDEIQAELDRLGSTTGVDLELERMKAELGMAEPQKEIGQAAPADQAKPAGPQSGQQQPGGQSPQQTPWPQQPGGGHQ
jgi:phage shock protein A